MNISCQWMVLFARPQAKCFKCIISYPHEVGAVLPIPGFQKNLYDTERFFSLWLYPPWTCSVSAESSHAQGHRFGMGWYHSPGLADCPALALLPHSLSWLTARQIVCIPPALPSYLFWLWLGAQQPECGTMTPRIRTWLAGELCPPLLSPHLAIPVT